MPKNCDNKKLQDNKLQDNTKKYITIIDKLLSNKDNKIVFIKNKKYQEMSIEEIPSCHYDVIESIEEYLKHKVDIIEIIYNHKEYDYCTIFMYKSDS